MKAQQVTNQNANRIASTFARSTAEAPGAYPVSCPITFPVTAGITRKLVGVAGFEPATPSSRTRCATEDKWVLQMPLLATHFND
jgi:hypothetical protein